MSDFDEEALRERWRQEGMPDAKTLMRRIGELEARCAQLTEATKEACDEYEYAAQYKGEFLAEKHGDAETLTRLRALITPDATKAAAEFVERIRAGEREACAKVADQADQDDATPAWAAAAIRARTK